MKHPALTRLFAVVLAVLCLTMLLAGLGSVGSALSERKKEQGDLDRLNGRIGEYREVLNALEGGDSYQQTDLALREEQEKHDEQASQHRIDLAIYTATRSGVRSGLGALFQADEALAEGEAQYEEGKALFEEQEAAFWAGYEQFQEGKRQLEEAKRTMDLAQSALADARAQLEQARAMGELLDSDDENARLEMTVEAYDALLSSLDQGTALYASLKDQGGVSPEQMQMLAALLAQNGVDLSWLPEDFSWEGISAEQMQEMEDRVVQSTGMTVEEIRALIQEQRDSLSEQDGEEPISEEQFAAMQAAYRMNREQVQAIFNAMEQELDEYEAQLTEAQSQLAEAQAQMDAMEEVLEQGKAGIEQGRAAIDEAGEQLEQAKEALKNGRWQLWKKQMELEEQAEALRQEKLKLDAETEDLNDKAARAEELKALEQQESSLRLTLLDREEIRDRVDRGMDLLNAAEDYTAVRRMEIAEKTRNRLLVGALMILGGLAGFVGIPAAFEKWKSRFLLIAPVLLCLACAAGVETMCRMLGRGDSYSALAAGVFALVQLALVIPKKKKA